MTMGSFGAPSRPSVEAMGIPVSMWVAWMSPLESESRMAAQLAPFTTVESMPYFLNIPFSCAIKMGEQSVSAIMPNRSSVTSGRSPADDAALGADEEALASDLQPPRSASDPSPAPAPARNPRRPSVELLVVDMPLLLFMIGLLLDPRNHLRP